MHAVLTIGPSNRGTRPQLTSRIAVFVLAAALGCSSHKEASPTGGSPAAQAPVVTPTQPQTAFWTWFQHDAEALRANKDLQQVMEQISAEIAKVAPGVFAEIGANGDDRTLVLSVNGKQDLFPAVQALYAARPTVSHWTIVAFRQRAKPGEPALQIQLGDVTIDPIAVKFVARRHADKLDLDVFLPGAMSDDQRGEIGFVLLDHAVGEYDMETRIAGITFGPITKAPATAKPLTELPAQVDALH